MRREAATDSAKKKKERQKEKVEFLDQKEVSDKTSAVNDKEDFFVNNERRKRQRQTGGIKLHHNKRG